MTAAAHISVFLADDNTLVREGVKALLELGDPKDTWSVPKDWGTTGFMYRSDLVKEKPTTWKEFVELTKGVDGLLHVYVPHATAGLESGAMPSAWRMASWHHVSGLARARWKCRLRAPSLASRTMTGTSEKPHCTAAWYRRSPATIW